ASRSSLLRLMDISYFPLPRVTKEGYLKKDSRKFPENHQPVCPTSVCHTSTKVSEDRKFNATGYSMLT
ncbi:hypothetical protein, partial [Laspinema olomoucense]|uniref:hypothetical protein n=1 Tax=Laspinema olomoucense TaxID=3231600 RepID=UPI0021BAA9BB